MLQVEKIKIPFTLVALCNLPHGERQAGQLLPDVRHRIPRLHRPQDDLIVLAADADNALKESPEMQCGRRGPAKTQEATHIQQSGFGPRPRPLRVEGVPPVGQEVEELGFLHETQALLGLLNGALPLDTKHMDTDRTM